VGADTLVGVGAAGLSEVLHAATVITADSVAIRNLRSMALSLAIDGFIEPPDRQPRSAAIDPPDAPLQDEAEP
jgi:hypothetical protein